MAVIISTQLINHSTFHLPFHNKAMDHTKMDHQSMPSMPTTFFTSTSTSLYITAWTPKTDSQYALTCLFLVSLCIVFRALLAARCNLTKISAWIRPRKDETAEHTSCCVEENGVEKPLRGVLMPSESRRNHDEDASGRPRIWEVLLQALLDTVLAVVSYLL